MQRSHCFTGARARCEISGNCSTCLVGGAHGLLGNVVFGGEEALVLRRLGGRRAAGRPGGGGSAWASVPPAGREERIREVTG